MSQNTLVEGSLGPALDERRKYSPLSADGLADRIAAHDTAGLSAVVPTCVYKVNPLDIKVTELT
jgi:hypothetical protein